MVKNKILEDESYALKINPDLLNSQKLFFNSTIKLYNDVMPKLLVIFNKESNKINIKTSKQLREFNVNSYYIKKLAELNKIFNDIYKEEFYQKQNYLTPDMQDVKKIKFFFYRIY